MPAPSAFKNDPAMHIIRRLDKHGKRGFYKRKAEKDIVAVMKSADGLMHGTCQIKLSHGGWISVKTNQFAITSGENELEMIVAMPSVLVNACPKAGDPMDSLEDDLLGNFSKKKLKLAPFVNAEFCPLHHTNPQTLPCGSKKVVFLEKHALLFSEISKLVWPQLPLCAKVQDMLMNELQHQNLPVPPFAGLFTCMAIKWTPESKLHTLEIPLGKLEGGDQDYPDLNLQVEL
ncbi:hypothetical protein BJ741DRAFT_707946 [Chytriomyces cf. hyalinus JEL632]|nr:hypothetical protein BJ741DRAFT_707946 [Chytriomyces cf. hyalinus JEL632]